ncbi:DUF4126 domain-containing protein [Synechocystis sp. PCC 7509]|uniref:DUF4126 domain-containing protein n=1 Tax=Synechocystis sp. PCC 7509 TaxID=927677 RepID=UPI0002ACFA19|nr:DUF4126 domain-containing protein [Synechocystis sp. PCC 7509]
MAISMNTLESIIIGLTLSSACGFRIFVPPLVISLAVIFGHLPITSGFEWVGTYSALWAFAIATIVEIGAYYVPVLDNLLDTLATPTALAVGTFVAAAVFPDSDPLLQWTTAAIAGGGTAGILQAVTGITRLSSTALTIGLGNAFVATVESIGAITLSVLALVAPLIAVSLVAILLLFSLNKVVQSRVTRKH